MSSTKKQILPRSGSLEDRLITRYGKFLGGRIIFNAVIGFLTFILSLFLCFILFCAGIIIDSSYHVSFLVNVTSIVIMSLILCLYFVVLRKTDSSDFSEFLKNYFSLQSLIAIMAFAQTFFWMIDSTNSIHEPRSVFLLSMAVFLAYFRDRFTTFVMRLIAISAAPQLENLDVLPFDL